MKIEIKCSACGEYLETIQMDDNSTEKLPVRRCPECALEQEEGIIPVVTDNPFKPPGTGTCYRQQVGRGRTDT